MTFFELSERIKCPLCEEHNQESLFAINYSDDKVKEYLLSAYAKLPQFREKAMFELIKCPSCKFMYQKYIPSFESMHILYSDLISSEKSFAKSQTSSKKQSSLNDARFAVALKSDSYARFLDFGAGWGGWSLQASEFRKNIYAFEISPSRINYLRKNAKIKVIDSTQHVDKFDYINLCQVLEHVEDPIGLLLHLKSILNIGGIIHISTPNSSFAPLPEIPYSFVLQKGPFQPLEHINSFDFKTLKFAANQAGLKLVNDLQVIAKGTYGIKRYLKKHVQNAPDWYFVSK